VTQTGVLVLEVGMILVAGDREQLGRRIIDPHPPFRAAPQPAAPPLGAVTKVRDEERKFALRCRPGVVPRRFADLPEGPQLEKCTTMRPPLGDGSGLDMGTGLA